MAISKCRGKLVKEIITKSEVTIVLVAGVREVGISTILNECAEVLSKTSSVLTINSSIFLYPKNVKSLYVFKLKRP